MRVAIVGSRNYPDLEQVELFVRALARKYPHAVIFSGGAAGVDHEAEETARSMMMHVVSYRPKKRERHYQILLVETGRFVTTVKDADGSVHTEKTFRDAAFFRNGLIVRDADQVVAFHYQNSNGTRDSIKQAEALGTPVTTYHPREEVR